MSDLAAAAAATGVPEELLLRAAHARAEAQGVSADDLLAAWGGGAPAPVAATAAAAPEPAAPSPQPAEPPVEELAADADADAVAVAVAEPIAVAAPPELEPEVLVEPESLGARIGAGVRIGAVLGTIFGIILAVLAAPLVFDSLNAIQDEAGTRFVAELRPLAVVIGVAVLSAVFGGFVARAAVLVPAWMRPGLAVSTRPAVSVMVGTVTGLLLGLLAAGILVGGLGEESVLEGHVAIDIIGSVVLAFIGGSVLGAATGGVTQLLARPVGSLDEADDAVRERLNTAFLTPLLVVGGIAVIVVSLGYLVFVQLPAAAPYIAILAAGGILGFAALTASGTSKIKVGATEFFVAALGVGIVVLFIALVFQAQSGGHG